MLRSLKIKQFKSIYSAQLYLGRVNLFIGPNGAGKSNVLEALAILAGSLSRGLDPTSLDERGIRLSVPTMFKSSFKNTKLPNTFRLEAEFEHGRYECSIRAGLKRHTMEFYSEALFDGDTKVFGRGPNGIFINRQFVPETVIREDFLDVSRGVWDVLSPFARISAELRQEIDDISEFSIYAPQTSIMRGVAVDPRVKSPLGLTGAGLASALQEVVAGRLGNTQLAGAIDKVLKIIWEPGWADSVTVKPFDPGVVPSHVKSDGQLLYIRDKFMMTNRNFLSAFDASEGTLYLIFVAALLAHPDAPRIFALDNVDGTLNSRLVRKLTDSVVDVCAGKESAGDMFGRGRQVFVTSHHPSSLDSFDLYNPEQAVFVVHRDTKAASARGSTKFDRLLPPPDMGREDWYRRTNGKNLSVLLLDGIIPDAL